MSQSIHLVHRDYTALRLLKEKTFCSFMYSLDQTFFNSKQYCAPLEIPTPNNTALNLW